MSRRIRRFKVETWALTFEALSVRVRVAPGRRKAKISVERLYRHILSGRLYQSKRYYRYTPERAARIDAVLNRPERPDVTVKKNREEMTSTYVYDCYYKRPPFYVQIALTDEKILISRLMFRTDGERRRVVKVCYRSYTSTPQRRAALLLAAARKGAIFTPNEWGVLCAFLPEKWQ